MIQHDVQARRLQVRSKFVLAVQCAGSPAAHRLR